jgi:hypothetical protein
VATVSRSSCDGDQKGDFVALVQALLALDVRALENGQRRGERGRQGRLLGAERGEQVVDAGAVVEVDRQQRRVREAAQSSSEAYSDTHNQPQ